jgi:hypothetical protein
MTLKNNAIQSIKDYTTPNQNFHVTKKYGNYVYKYRRNPKTTWYIIYTMKDRDIYINKIISNHITKLTKEENENFE